MLKDQGSPSDPGINIGARCFEIFKRSGIARSPKAYTRVGWRLGKYWQMAIRIAANTGIGAPKQNGGAVGRSDANFHLTAELSAASSRGIRARISFAPLPYLWYLVRIGVRYMILTEL